uniref:High affinity cationic amino acid transporter 1 n=1 Tax=Magallana gigas TaxID=29159 RepID=K1QPE4_MAGGI
MSPYYLLDHDAPLPEVFSQVGWDVARYIIAVGAVCGLSTSLLGAMFPLPRVIYAMASDGLLFQFLGTVSERFKTPVAGTLLSGLFAGFMAMMFDLKELVDMMSIGTLLAYTLVAVSVLLLRYRVNSFNQYRADDGDSLILNDTSSVGYLQQMFNHKLRTPTHLSETVSFWNITIICVLIIAESLILIFLEDFISSGVWWSIALVSVVGLLIFILVYSTWLQPQNQDLVNFKVPLLPILPVISVFVNVYLMLKLSSATWIRFGVWMFLGMKKKAVLREKPVTVWSFRRKACLGALFVMYALLVVPCVIDLVNNLISSRELDKKLYTIQF